MVVNRKNPELPWVSTYRWIVGLGRISLRKNAKEVKKETCCGPFKGAFKKMSRVDNPGEIKIGNVSVQSIVQTILH